MTDNHNDASAGSGKGEKKVTLTIVVTGTPTKVEANLNAALGSVIERALNATGNIGQAVDGWELRDEHGVLLDAHRKLREYGFVDGTTLFLTLKAGVGG
jgi:hypothetical protein